MLCGPWNFRGFSPFFSGHGLSPRWEISKQFLTTTCSFSPLKVSTKQYILWGARGTARGHGLVRVGWTEPWKYGMKPSIGERLVSLVGSYQFSTQAAAWSQDVGRWSFMENLHPARVGVWSVAVAATNCGSVWSLYSECVICIDLYNLELDFQSLVKTWRWSIPVFTSIHIWLYTSQVVED